MSSLQWFFWTIFYAVLPNFILLILKMFHVKMYNSDPNTFEFLATDVVCTYASCLMSSIMVDLMAVKRTSAYNSGNIATKVNISNAIYFPSLGLVLISKLSPTVTPTIFSYICYAIAIASALFALITKTFINRYT